MAKYRDALYGFVTAYKRDLLIGLIFAIVWAVIWDLVKTGCVVGFRRLKNKLSELSVSRLRNRIVELEGDRDRIRSLASDKALYLFVLRILVAMTTLVCMGEAIRATHSFLRVGIVLEPLSAFCFIVAAIFGVWGIRMSQLSTPTKVAARVKE
jgi:hypothetical protein